MRSRRIHYPGHLGPETVLVLRDATRAYRFRQGEAREIPEPDASDAVLRGGFHGCLTPAECARRFGLDLEDVKGLRKGSALTSAKAGKVSVIVLDARTRKSLREAAASQKISDPDFSIEETA